MIGRMRGGKAISRQANRSDTQGRVFGFGAAVGGGAGAATWALPAKIAFVAAGNSINTDWTYLGKSAVLAEQAVSNTSVSGRTTAAILAGMQAGETIGAGKLDDSSYPVRVFGIGEGTNDLSNAQGLTPAQSYAGYKACIALAFTQGATHVIVRLCPPTGTQATGYTGVRSNYAALNTLLRGIAADFPGKNIAVCDWAGDSITEVPNAWNTGTGTTTNGEDGVHPINLVLATNFLPYERLAFKNVLGAANWPIFPWLDALDTTISGTSSGGIRVTGAFLPAFRLVKDGSNRLTRLSGGIGWNVPLEPVVASANTTYPIVSTDGSARTYLQCTNQYAPVRASDGFSAIDPAGQALFGWGASRKFAAHAFAVPVVPASTQYVFSSGDEHEVWITPNGGDPTKYDVVVNSRSGVTVASALVPSASPVIVLHSRTDRSGQDVVRGRVFDGTSLLTAASTTPGSVFAQGALAFMVGARHAGYSAANTLNAPTNVCANMRHYGSLFFSLSASADPSTVEVAISNAIKTNLLGL